MEVFRDEKFTLKANGSEGKVYWKVMVIVADVVFYKKLTIKSGTWVSAILASGCRNMDKPISKSSNAWGGIVEALNKSTHNW